MSIKDELIFWEDEVGFVAYVSEYQHVYGHVVLQYTNRNHDINFIPPNFETAANFVTFVLLQWANKYKGKNCHPIMLRMNIAREVFRVHFLPLSSEEIEESSALLSKNILEYNSGQRGGILAWLGNKEIAGDTRVIRNDINYDHLLETTEQLKEVISKIYMFLER